MRAKNVLIDVAAAAAGVLTSWVVADLVVSAAEGRKPLIADPKRLPDHFREDHDRIQGVFHLALAIYDGMHITYHVRRARNKSSEPKSALRHVAEGGHSVFTFLYHTAFAYVKHLDEYERKQRDAR